jgi:hypothetical protein
VHVPRRPRADGRKIVLIPDLVFLSGAGRYEVRADRGMAEARPLLLPLLLLWGRLSLGRAAHRRR